jgi:hypothetical protein
MNNLDFTIIISALGGCGRAILFGNGWYARPLDRGDLGVNWVRWSVIAGDLLNREGLRTFHTSSHTFHLK